MKIGVRVPPSAPLTEIVALARRAEAAGLSHVWFPDSHLNFRDVWTTLGAVAVSTDRIGIGPSVTNLVSRHPSVTASAARSLYEICGDRFVLGIGAGDSAIGHSGLRHSSTAELREGMAQLRLWMSGADSDDCEVVVRHRGAVPPVFLAASGPANLRLAAEVADGVVTPLARLDEKSSLLRSAGEKAGRTGQVELAVTAMCLRTDDLDRDAPLLSPFVVRVAQLEGTEMFERAGLAVSVPDHLVGAVGDLGHPASLVDAAEVAARYVSPEAALWWAHNCTVSGDGAGVAAGLAGLADRGVDRVTLSSPTASLEGLIDFLADVSKQVR